ncbi:MAG: tRNA lysidine(34) synthetase TilS, partial [Clostridia bacterium]|nr:tRNA lysidine(34) synthetase TilS [Clostridia bacterium]
MCLLFLLHTLQKKIGFRLGACHIHHGIRGAEADKDLEFCQCFCNDLAIPFFWERVNVTAFCKKQKIGLEEGARILRYQALNRIAQNEGFDKIATAHTASDQAETVLFHLIRGSGFHGLEGIRSQRGNIIRPLLPFYQDEIRQFLETYSLNVCEDSTNRDVQYARNRLRNNVLPEMKNINPSVEKALCRLSLIASEQEALVSMLCDQWEEKNGIRLENGSAGLSALSSLS